MKIKPFATSKPIPLEPPVIIICKLLYFNVLILKYEYKYIINELKHKILIKINNI